MRSSGRGGVRSTEFTVFKPPSILTRTKGNPSWQRRSRHRLPGRPLIPTRRSQEVLGAADAGYDDARKVWNGMIDKRPGLIVRCLGVGDVIEAVNFAGSHGAASSM
jgi:hypothetical protein